MSRLTRHCADDELEGRDLRVADQILLEPFGNPHVDLAALDRPPFPEPFGDHVSVLLEQILNPLTGEEPEVSVVEQPDRAIAPFALEERDADAAVGDVRDRGHDSSAIGEEPS